MPMIRNILTRLTTIKHQLEEDLKNLSRWFEANELLINLKPGKTKLLLFGFSIYGESQ